MGTESIPQREDRNFGLLKTRSMQVKQAQVDIVRGVTKNDGDESFARMSHEELFRIVREETDLKRKRSLSKWFNKKSGIYARAVRYISDLYKFDFMVYPNLDLNDELDDKKQDTIRKNFNKILEHFDNSSIQLICRKWAQTICLEGCYYGYICDDVPDKLVIQDLPVDYCRSRFNHRGIPLVEFNVQYFDKVARNNETKEKLLNLFPKEIQVGYRKYKNNKLPPEEQGDKPGWIMLDFNYAFKLNFSDNDIPPFLCAIPSLLELEEVQDLQKEKLLQEIQKILIQQFELDKNGQIPFSMTELQQLNQNAIDMIGDSVGVSVLSTVADVHLENVGTTTAQESRSAVDEAEDDAYNHFGISTNLFNTDGNLSLDKSVVIDEAFAKPMVLQFEQFFNRYVDWKFNKSSSKFRFKMLPTTVFNYKEYSNSYKDLTKLGFSRFLPMVALGHTQKEIISLAKVEQQILQLDAYMLPPFSSNTMSSDTWTDVKALQSQILGGNKKPALQTDNKNPQNQSNQSGAAKAAASVSEEGSKGGRPTLPDDKKSDKTIANLSSQ